MTVNTGLFGVSESFVPLELASFSGGDALSVPVTKAQVKDAPQVTAQTESVQVPVSGEEVRLEREPLTESNRGGSGWTRTASPIRTGTADSQSGTCVVLNT